MDKTFAYSHKIKICVEMGCSGVASVMRGAHGGVYYAAVKSACGG